MDKSLVFAERYRSNPAPLEQALLGGQNSVTDPYTALNALQKIKQAGQMQTAQMAQQAPAANAQPSIKDSTVAAVNQNRTVAPGVDSDLQNYFGTGGIVAFAMGGVPVKGYKGNKGSVTSSSNNNVSSDNDADAEEAAYQQSAPANYADPIEGDDDLGGDGSGAQQYKDYISGLSYKAPDKKQTRGEIAQEMQEAQEVMGLGDPYGDYRKTLQEQEAGAPQELEQGKGIALLKAAAAMAQGNNFVRALGNAGGEFGSAYGDALKADQAAKAHRNEMRFHLADAERKEKLGLYKDAAESVAASHAAAFKSSQFELEKAKALGTLTLNEARLKGAQNKTGAQISPTNLLYNAQTAYNANPTKENLASLQAAQKAIAATKTTFGTMLSGYVGGDQPKGDIESQKATTQSRAQEDAAVKNAGKEFKDYQEGLVLDTNMRKLQRTNPDEYNKKIEAKRKEIYETNGVGHRLPGASRGATPALPSGYNLDQ